MDIDEKIQQIVGSELISLETSDYAIIEPILKYLVLLLTELMIIIEYIMIFYTSYK